MSGAFEPVKKKIFYICQTMVRIWAATAGSLFVNPIEPDAGPGGLIEAVSAEHPDLSVIVRVARTGITWTIRKMTLYTDWIAGRI